MSHAGIVFLDETPRRRRKSNGLGVLGCIFSVLGVLTFGLLSPIGLGLSLLGLLRGPRGAAKFGVVLGLMGTAFLAVWGGMIVAGVHAAHDARNQQITKIDLVSAVATIEEYRRDHGELPEGIDGNKLLISAEFNDAWGQPLRYDPLNMDGRQPNDFAVRSAGPDGEFDTRDDLTRSQSPK